MTGAPISPDAMPAARFRSAVEAAAALSLAGPAGVLLLSAPAAAAWPGAAAIAAMLARAATAHPGVPHRAALDCGTAPGLALDALRQGWRLLILDGGHPSFPQVAAAAREAGATLLPAAPEALDLTGIDLRRPGGRAILARHLAVPGKRHQTRTESARNGGEPDVTESPPSANSAPPFHHSEGDSAHAADAEGQGDPLLVRKRQSRHQG